MKRSFYVKAVWDDEAGVYISDSDIDGLHIQADTLDEFEAVMNDAAPELIVANHYASDDLASTPMRDLIPSIFWCPPKEAAAA